MFDKTLINASKPRKHVKTGLSDATNETTNEITLPIVNACKPTSFNTKKANATMRNNVISRVILVLPAPSIRASARFY